MTSTLVIQSHTDPLPHVWLRRCIETVQQWCHQNNYQYRWMGDELLDGLEQSLLKKVEDQIVVASDLGRLHAIRTGLETHDRVVWLDTDFLVFDATNFVLPSANDNPLNYRVGREVWVQEDQTNPAKLKAYVKVHNAFLLFDRGNSFLDFYIEHATKMLRECTGKIPPQFIGPKLLTAIHNVIGCPVLETAGMLSPSVIDDLLSDGERCCALNLMHKRSQSNLAGANLCSSLVGQSSESERNMNRLIDLLLSLPDGL